jgi:hypothetical protein
MLMDALARLDGLCEQVFLARSSRALYAVQRKIVGVEAERAVVGGGQVEVNVN